MIPSPAIMSSELCSAAIMSSKLYGVASVLAGLLLIINTSCLAASANDGGQFSSLRLVGNVFCDTCFRQQFSTNSYFISGASVAVQCRTNKQQKPDFRLEAKTNEYGEFKFELPPSIFHSHEQVQRCSTTLLKNSQGSCKVASMAKSSSFSLKSKQGGIYTYSAGSFTYRPPSPPPICSKDASETATLFSFKKARFPKSGLKVSSASGSSFKPTQLSPLLPPTSLLPPLPTIPPVTPGLPNPLQPPPLIPGLPNPLQPPPLIPGLPNPLQPPPLIPGLPNPLQPPPLIPGLPNPLQPPPLIPGLPNPLQPPPLIPGLPNPLQPPPLIPGLPNPLQPPPLIPIPPAQHTLLTNP